MQETRPVMIVGAGPTGLTAAMELSRFGVPVRLVDRYSTPQSTSRALAVQARTLELFFQRGLSEEMVHLGNKGRSITMYANAKTLGSISLEGLDSRFNFILLLPQSETERILRECVERQGVVVERQKEMIAFSQGELHGESSGVQVTLRHGDGTLEEVDASYLIDAEGAHSTVRHTLGLPFQGKALPHSYALADLHLDGELPEDNLTLFLSDCGLLVAFPLGQHRFRIIATEKGENLAGDAPEPELSYMQKMWQQSSHIPARLYDMIWSSRFRVNSRALDRLRLGRIFFGGDSAHVHSPAGGQGMNTGIQDMINLGWKLATVYKGVAKPALLDSYDSERMPVIRTLVNTTETGTDLFDSDSSFERTLLVHALPLAMSLSAVRSQGSGFASELNVNYRKSPLNIPGKGSGSLHPGDRVPDLIVSGETGEESLLSLLDPSRFTLLFTSEAPTLGSALRRTMNPKLQRISPARDEDRAKIFSQTLGVAKWLLVRPDGYFIGVSAEADGSLEHWRPFG